MLHKTIDAENIYLMNTVKKSGVTSCTGCLISNCFLLSRIWHSRTTRRLCESSLNKGNFLEMVEMLSNYDPVLKEHLMRLKWSTCTLRPAVSYLAPETQNGFTNVLANHVKEMCL